jgi:hypothetical protein
MPIEITVALIGGVFGLICAALGYVAAIRSAKIAGQLQEASAHRERIIDLMTDFLTEQTAAQAKQGRDGFFPNLDGELERLYKNLYMHGYKEIALQVRDMGQSYLSALKQYAEGGLTPAELNNQRLKTRNFIAEKMKNI